MPINLAYLEQRLSGGSGNTSPGASLGGAMSSERVLSQSSTALSNITGVTIEYAAGNPLGAGSLVFTASGQTLIWTAFSGGAGTAVAVGSTGKYTIRSGSGGFLCVSVVAGSLPGGNQTDSVTIANIANETFDDVTKQESFDGDTEYRCFYFYNAHPTDPFLDLVLFIGTQPQAGTLYVGADPAGVGDGLIHTLGAGNLTRSGSTATAVFTSHGYTTGQSIRVAGASQSDYNGVHTITVVDPDTFTFAVANSPATPATGTITISRGVPLTVADESTSPSGVSFTAPSAETPSGISLGQLDAGEAIAYWEKRVIPTRNATANAATTSVISAQAYF